MPRKDPRIDAYIARSADFARPILNRLRRLVHAACPVVEETIKWHAPFYLHRGILLATPAFKKHCAVIFWKSRWLLDRDQKAKLRRLGSSADLPGDKFLLGCIRKAVGLNKAGVKSAARAKPKAKSAPVVPDDFQAALRKSKKAQSAFANFSPSHKREYVEWIAGAKREETRARRIRTALSWLAQGKSRNWKYQ